VDTIMKVYGWTELNECCYGIECISINKDDIFNIDKDTKEVSCYTEGCWYTTFREAKNAAITYLKNNIYWMRDAIKEIKKSRKHNI